METILIWDYNFIEFPVSIESKRNGNSGLRKRLQNASHVSIESKRNGNDWCDITTEWTSLVSIESKRNGNDKQKRVAWIVVGAITFQSNLRGMETRPRKDSQPRRF